MTAAEDIGYCNRIDIFVLGIEHFEVPQRATELFDATILPGAGMGNFLPLIEGFAAFALTMLALATAVGAIYGACERGVRLRARGMRDMMEFFYRNEVQPLLEERRLAATTYEGSYTFPEIVTAPGVLTVETLLGYGSMGRCIAAAPASVENLDFAFATGTTGALAVTLAPGKNVPGAPQTVKYSIRTNFVPPIENEVGNPLNTFLTEMTLLPIPITTEGRSILGTWLDRLVWRRGKKPKGTWSEARAREFLIASDDFYSLKYTVDSLAEPEFATKLRASEIGRLIAEARSENEWEACLARLKERFSALGRAASERFARRARLWTVVVGFVLAFGVNIDSINLLNRYLSDNTLSKELLAQQAEAPAAGAPVDAAQEIVTQVASVEAAFPVGWDLFPICPAAVATDGQAAETAMPADLRCTTEDNVFGQLKWLFGVLITGVLVGLGAPFWTEVFNNFLKARNLVNAYRDGSARRSV